MLASRPALSFGYFWLQAYFLLQLGADPKQKPTKSVHILPAVESRLSHFMDHGLPAELKEEILSQYDFAPRFTAPKLNKELLGSLSEASRKREGHFFEKHSITAAVTALVSAALSDTLVSSPTSTSSSLLFDASRLLAQLYFSLTTSRKAFIEPGFSKQARLVLKETAPSDLLFGPDVTAGLNAAHTMAAMAEKWKASSPSRDSDLHSKSGNKQFSTAKKGGGTKSYYGRRKRPAYKSKESSEADKKA